MSLRQTSAQTNDFSGKFETHSTGEYVEKDKFKVDSEAEQMKIASTASDYIDLNINTPL